MGADEFVDDVRFWVGCAGPVAPVVCAAWNTGMLDTGATHASCCDFPEAARAVAALVKGTITALRSHGRHKRSRTTNLALTNLQLTSERRPATRSRPRMHPSAAHRPYAVECTETRTTTSSPVCGLNTFQMGLNTSIFGRVLRPILEVLRPILWVLRSILGVLRALLWVLHHR